MEARVQVAFDITTDDGTVKASFHEKVTDLKVAESRGVEMVDGVLVGGPITTTLTWTTAAQDANRHRDIEHV